MKLHWGTGIVIAFLLFAAGILVMVYVSMNREVDLVADDYYQQELRHQDHIESARRTNVLAERPKISLSNAVLALKLPRELAASHASGVLTFYRPADRKRDFIVPLKLDSTGTQFVQTSSLQKGLWRLKVRWSVKNESYYHEEPIIIQ
jgi:nitrogen fixation protein FixH